PWPLHAFAPLQECFSAVAQPPLPLQEFLPAQPASPVLHPPMPLHEFMPLQACFAIATASAVFSAVLAAGADAGFSDSLAVQPGPEPASMPATATGRSRPEVRRGSIFFVFMDGSSVVRWERK